MNLFLSDIKLFNEKLDNLPNKKLLINTINAHCYNISQKDYEYMKALYASDVLLPDGVSVVLALQLLKNKRLTKIAGADLFFYEMERLNQTNGKCFFLGSTESTLQKIRIRIAKEYPRIKVESYSPPFKKEFSEEDNKIMLEMINAFNPDALMVGMTAPKQEKWAYKHYELLNVGHICCIGAVFDFYAGNINRAPKWMINLGLEWFYRLIREPARMWRRYILGNLIFIYYIFKEITGSRKP
jgi:N-acetylglucosaminyldiphosphoundecaprenol N-acetyl-beta-D-mannosaminyltransferase